MSIGETTKIAEDNEEREGDEEKKKETRSAFANATSKMKWENTILYMNTNTCLWVCGLNQDTPFSARMIFFNTLRNKSVRDMYVWRLVFPFEISITF